MSNSVCRFPSATHNEYINGVPRVELKEMAMSKKKSAKKQAVPTGEKLGTKAYDKELAKLHVELVKLQE